MSLDFTAIDFETANSSLASPCAVGLVRVRNGQITDSLELLIKPPYPNDWFSPMNIQVHGITQQMVQGAPEFATAFDQMLAFIEDDILIAHNASFDMGVLRSSLTLSQIEIPSIRYSCSLQIARKTYNLESYRLNAVAYAIGHEEFDHHNALADSDACAKIVIHAAKRHESSNLEELLQATKLSLRNLD